MQVILVSWTEDHFRGCMNSRCHTGAVEHNNSGHGCTKLDYNKVSNSILKVLILKYILCNHLSPSFYEMFC